MSIIGFDGTDLLVLVISVFVVWISCEVLGYATERWVWNNGICRRSGKPWKLVNKGALYSYYDDGCDHHCEIRNKD